MNRSLFLPLLLSGLTLFAGDNPAGLTYPKTKKTEHTDTYWGTKVEDPYQWLENDTSAETGAWVAEQNKVTFDYLANIPYRDQLKARYQQLFDFAKVGAPVFLGNTIFYYKKDGLQNQPVIYMQDGLAGKPEVFIDPNALDPKGLSVYEIKGGYYADGYDCSAAGISDDGKFAVVSLKKAGSDWGELLVYDIASKTPTGDRLQWIKSTAINWYKDGFFYSRYPAPAAGAELSAKNEFMSVYYHKLGDAQEKDELIYRDPKEGLTYNYAYTSEDGEYLFLHKALGTYGNELYWRKTADKGAGFKPLFTGYKNEYGIVDVIDGKFLVHTDDGASNKQVVLVDPANPAKENWQKVIPEQSDAMLEGVYTTNNKLFCKYLQNATNKLFVMDMNGQDKKEIPLPGPGSLTFTSGKRTDKMVALTFTSFNYPASIFTYDIASEKTTLFLKPDLTFNPEDYTSKQVWYTSKDGTKVSMFIAHKKGLILDGKNPTYLYGYGGFSQNMTPAFSTSRILLMENNAIIAIPNIRGGAEYGDDWHRAGMLMNKQNVFDDFIAAAEYLIQNKYTSSAKLAIAGGSNGGLLIGAVINQRPELFKVAFPQVGVMDMLKFHKFTIGWGWVPEYGSSEQSEEMFKYLLGYSPYHNLKPGVKYPATFVTTADHDDRVVPAHSFKYAARLQEYNDGTNPTLIRIGVDAGHGAGKPTSKIIDEVGDAWSFFFWNMGYKSLPSNKMNTWPTRQE